MAASRMVPFTDGELPRTVNLSNGLILLLVSILTKEVDGTSRKTMEGRGDA